MASAGDSKSKREEDSIKRQFEAEIYSSLLKIWSRTKAGSMTSLEIRFQRPHPDPQNQVLHLTKSLG